MNTRFGPERWTPLLRWCAELDPLKSAAGHQLLLEHGANIDARTRIGNTPAHLIARNAHAIVCQTLADAGWLAAADLTLLNDKGETALQISENKTAEDPTSADKHSINILLHEHATMWKQVVSPVLHEWLSHSALILDVAHVVLSFVDGQERSRAVQRQ